MRYVILGCGRLGAELAMTLDRDGHDVTVVDKSPTAFERLGSLFSGRLVEGIGFDRDVLSRAELGRADGFAAVTNHDNTNIIAGRVARMVFHVPRVVARVYDPQRAEIYYRLGLQTISSTTMGVNRIVTLLAHPGLTRVLSLGSGELEIVQAETPAHLVGRSVQDVVSLGEIDVVAITRGGKAMIPTRGTVFQEGDLIHFSVLVTAASRLSEMLQVM